ncbi:hypothetical protein DMUE_0364 [Dictyocoela muelleri]|nr:hypothetical protein DMUE_0364 [Dictyocoela muelleri]
MTKLISDHVRIGSLIITDGYSSYPQAVKNAMCNHEIVPHNIGFKNKKGFHTNNIENLWSQLKYEEKKKLGIKKSYINRFLNEFVWRYYNIKNYEFEKIGEKWFEIVVFLIKTKF